MFLRSLRHVTENTSFLKYVRDVLKTSHKRHLFWDVFETFERRHKKDIFFEMYLRLLKDVTKKPSLLRYFGEVFEISLSMEIWLKSLRDISYRLGRRLCKINILTMSPKTFVILIHRTFRKCFWFKITYGLLRILDIIKDARISVPKS